MYVIQCIPEYFWHCGQHTKWSAILIEKPVNHMLIGQIISYLGLLINSLCLHCLFPCNHFIDFSYLSLYSFCYFFLYLPLFSSSSSSSFSSSFSFFTECRSSIIAELYCYIIYNTGSEVVWRTCSGEDIWVTVPAISEESTKILSNALSIFATWWLSLWYFGFCYSTVCNVGCLVENVYQNSKFAVSILHMQLLLTAHVDSSVIWCTEL